MEGPTSLIPITEIIRLVSIVRKFDCLFIKSEDFPLEFSTRAVSVVLHTEHLKLLEQVCVIVWLFCMEETFDCCLSCYTLIGRAFYNSYYFDC